MDTKSKPPVKEKRRNNEKRKEKSRDAARCRRSRETEIFTDIAKALPLATEQVSQLDKASVMRLAISYFRVRDMVKLVPELKTDDDNKNINDESVFLKSLEGFLLVLSPDGDFVYLSENVSDYLGITQIDLMGQNVYEYSHPCDHDEIREILAARTQEDTENPKNFFIRLKCTLTSKGRSVNLKSATYKVIHCTGHILQAEQEETKKEEETKKNFMQHCLVSIGQPIPHPSNIEYPLPRQTFFTKHSLDMKFTHADDKIMKEILGYNSEDLIGKSVYEYHHALDSDSIGAAYKCLFSKGQCETNRYRFLAKTGGYVWVLTQATLIYDKMQKPQSVVCVNYVISGVECKDEIYSSSQLSCIKSENLCKTTIPEIILTNTLEEVEEVVQKTTVPKDKSTVNTKTGTANLLVPYIVKPAPVSPQLPPRLQTATSKLFAPRTEEMSKGFLTFSEEEPGLTMLKDEPDDLTHLAPVAGDVCVPLEDHPFLTDMLDDFLLRDNFCPLLTDEPTDPFISYRDSCDPSPQLLSPNLSKNSECSLPSMNSPSDSLGDEDHMSTFMSLQMEDDPELVMKAPYIPMNMDNDLPLLMSEDLMWNNNERNRNTPDSNSSLAQLLSSGVNKHSLKTNDHGGGLLQTADNMLENFYSNKSNWNLKTTKTTKQIPEPNERIQNVNNKRTNNSSTYDTSNKRIRNEPKEKMSSELLQQLMSNNHNRGRPKGKSNWLLDGGGKKAACISQPSDSVLMNLLPNQLENVNIKTNKERQLEKRIQLIITKNEQESNSPSRIAIRKNSISLLNPEMTMIPSLLELSQQDFDVNAPVNSFLLQGDDLLTALDINDPM